MSTPSSTNLSNALQKQLKQLAKTHPGHAERCHQLISQLDRGIPYPQLGGKQLHRRPGYFRFKIGQRYRLIACKENGSWIPDALLTHESYNNILKRRR